MVEAASSKRHSNRDTSNPRKKSLTHQRSSSQTLQQPTTEIWLGFPAMDELTKLVGAQPIDQSCPRTNEKAGLSAEEALELASAKIAFP
jgi:hypothetical protein